MTEQIKFSPGSLVSARGREWVVLPNPDEELSPDLLVLRPIDGSEAETTGILRSLETVEPATFAPPSPDDLGDWRSCQTLRDALRLTVRNAAGPFRSFGRISVEPRAYQFAPLALALKRSPVRLLIADDVGIGKTIEAGLILRELLDRGEIRRFCVVCPPYLVDQWQRELDEKFHLDAKIVAPNTVRTLERDCAGGESLFNVHRFTIVSLDYIKLETRRNEFLRSAPEALVFDEARSIATGDSKRRHLRYNLARELCSDPERHVLLLTATPHSGKDDAFRALLGLLIPAFLEEANLPTELVGKTNQRKREELSQWFVQRRRGDVRAYMDEQTPFPESQDREIAWDFSPEYRAFYEGIKKLVRSMFQEGTGDRLKRLGATWKALSLLRATSSSPAAVESALKRRCALPEGDETDGTSSNGEDENARIEECGKIVARYVLDWDANDEATLPDLTLGSESKDVSDSILRQMRDLAKEAERLKGVATDLKLQGLIAELNRLAKDGYNPIVFCRYLDTVDYLQKELQKALGSSFTIAAITGALPPEERERRVQELGDCPKRVLVCTDCLSEGINLQSLFDATIHYDLSWDPTRAEQREGRVDRFGQSRDVVRTLTFYGKENFIDGKILEVLLRKHKKIKKSLGVSVPIPCDPQQLLDALVNAIVESEEFVGVAEGHRARFFPEIEGEIRSEEIRARLETIAEAWDADAKRVQRQSQTYFAHMKLAPLLEEIKRELDATREAIGTSAEVRDFVVGTLRRVGAEVVPIKDAAAFQIDLADAPEALRARLRDYDYDVWKCSFDLPAPSGTEHISRTHPLVSGLADAVVDAALSRDAQTNPSLRALARRCGVVRTDAVKRKTILFLLRLRYHLTTTKQGDASINESLAEEALIAGFEGAPSAPRRLEREELDKVLGSAPVANVDSTTATEKAKSALGALPDWRPILDEIAVARASELKEARERVRPTGKQWKTEVRPELPLDIVGVYVYLPAIKLG